MRQRLRKITREAAARDIILLGQKSKIICAGEHPLESRTRIVNAALTQLDLCKPAGAGEESALGWRILPPHPPHMAILHEMRFDSIDGAGNARIAHREKADKRQEQQARVNGLGAVIGHESSKTLIVSLAANIRVNDVSQAGELAQLGGTPAPDLEKTVQRDPSRDLRIDMMTGLAALFPETLVGTAPDLRHVLHKHVLDMRHLMACRQACLK